MEFLLEYFGGHLENASDNKGVITELAPKRFRKGKEENLEHNPFSDLVDSLER